MLDAVQLLEELRRLARRIELLEHIEVPVVGGGGGAIGGAIAATQVAYGTGVNTIGGEAAFTYDAPTNVLTLDSAVPLPTLFYDAQQQPTGFEKDPDGEPPSDSTITYNPATRTITIAPTGASFNYWLRGQMHTVAAPGVSAVHGAATGVYYFYWDSTNVLQFTNAPFSIFEDVLIGYVYYNATLADGIPFEERHGADRNKAWHYSDHYKRGLYWHTGEGLAIGSYTLAPAAPADADNQWAISSGEQHDEDIAFQNTGRTSGSYEVFYRTGASGEWRWLNNNVPLLSPVGGYVYYNEWTGATWQLTALGVSDYVNYYICVTNSLDSDYDVFIIMGQDDFGSLAAAQADSAASLDYGTLPFQEILSIYKVTFRTNAAYGTEGKCRIEAVEDTRLTTGRQVISASPASNHNSLSGLQGGAVGEYYHITTAQHTALTGGTPGRITEWAAGPVLASSTLIKSGAGVLTLSAGGAYTLTVPASGAAVLRSSVTAFTAGRIPFATDGNTIADDSALIWDNVNKRLGIGAATPLGPLQINTATSIGGRILYTGALGAGSGGSFNLITTGTPTATGQRLGRVAFGFENGAYIAESALIAAFSEGAFTDGVTHPTRLQFETTASGAATRSVSMVIKESGNVLIGATTDQGIKLHVSAAADSTIPAAGAFGGHFAVLRSDIRGLLSGELSSGAYWFQAQRTDGTGTVYPLLFNPNGGQILVGTTTSAGGTSNIALIFGDNAGDPTPGSNTAGIFAKDVSGTVEMFGVDEAGNVNQLTPHNYAGPVQPLPGVLHWSQYHANSAAGVEKWYDMERALLALETLTGQQFIHTRRIKKTRRPKRAPQWLKSM